MCSITSRRPLLLAGIFFTFIQFSSQQNGSVGLEDFGCTFVTNNDCSTNNLKFTLFNRLEGKSLDAISPDAGLNFDPYAPTKVIFHGFSGGILELNPTYKIRDAYLEAGNTNVIMVDWSRLSTIPCYLIGLMNTRFVGKCTGELLVALKYRYSEFEPHLVHAIGFSMGSQAAAQTSNTVLARTGRKLRRLTGLDPRQSSMFRLLGISWLLDASDADFVDVIYTSAGNKGRAELKGNVEFYVNGGTSQRQCSSSLKANICSHLTAPGFFAESINSRTGFYGVHCTSYEQYIAGLCPKNQDARVLMGEPCCEPGTQGRFYVTTKSSPPFAEGRQNSTVIHR